MSPSIALGNSIFLTYLVIIGSVLGVAGTLLVALRMSGRKVETIWQTYRGWLIMAPFAVGAVFLGRIPFIVGVALLAMFGFREFARATGLHKNWWLVSIVYLAIVALATASIVPDPRLGRDGWYGVFMALPVYVVAMILVVPVMRNRTKSQLQQVSLAIVGFVYFGWMFSHLGFLANAPNAYGYLLYLLFAVGVNDIAAFTCGKLFGRHKLRDNISPNKTIEGALGAVMVSLIMPWLLWFSFPQFDLVLLVLTGLIVGIGGQLGDLVISFIKRDIGIKDMGATIKGHGGILDRIDSLIFVAPLFFHMVRWFRGFV